MFFGGWREWLKQTFQAGRRSPGRPFRPRVEGLEPRWTPTTTAFEMSPIHLTFGGLGGFNGFGTSGGGTVNWGDGTSEPASSQVTFAIPNMRIPEGGLLTIFGGHTYTEEGTYTVTFQGQISQAPLNVFGQQSGPAQVTPISFTDTVVVQEELKPDGTVGTPTERFVQEVYRDLLGRGLDPVGDAIWVGLLNGGASHEQVALDIERSPERRRDEVQALYLTLLGHFADDATVNNATLFLNTGGTLDQVRAVIAGSPEYFDKHGGSNDAFVTAVYSDFLHAAADPATRSAIDTALSNHTMTRQQVVATLLNTDAFRQVLVVGYFQEFLAHNVDPTDPAGGKPYVDDLRLGVRDEQVLASILGSQEYDNRVA